MISRAIAYLNESIVVNIIIDYKSATSYERGEEK